MKRCVRCVAVLLALVLVLAGATLTYLIRRGLSAREQPPHLEVWAAGLFRHLAVPWSQRQLPNPVPLTDEVLPAARAHFADHCASCHGNDGRGRTTLGQNLYPKAPDMTAARTQSMSDGEIFYTIRNGVRLTGMPAWGENTREDDVETWKLVHFIRHLREQTPAQIEEMESLNPKSSAEIGKAEEERRFLEGDEATPGAETTHK